MENQNNQIQQWLSLARKAGFSNSQIQAELTKNGWDNEQIQKVLTPKLTPSQLVKQELQASQNPLAPTGQPKLKNLKTKTLAIVISVVAGLFILGGLAFAGWKGYLPIPFLGNNAEKTLSKAIQKLSDIASGEVGVSFSIVGEARTANAKPMLPSKSNELSQTETKKQDSDSASNASQLRTGLALYFDSYDKFPAKLDELTSNKLLDSLPKQPAGYEITYNPSGDFLSYTLTYPCASDKTKTGKIIFSYTSSITELCYSGLTISDSSYLDTFSDLESFNIVPTDINLQGEFKTFIKLDKQNNKSPVGYLQIKGSYASSGTTLSVDGELRTKDKKYYAIIKEFPSLFIIDISALQNKWIVFDPSQDTEFAGFDLSGIENSAPKQEDTIKLKTELTSLLRVGLSKGALKITNDGREKINGRSLNRIKITIQPDFFSAAIQEYRDDAAKRGVNTDVLKELLQSLENPADIENLKTFANNSVLTVWVDQISSVPNKVEFSTIIIPPDTVTKFAGRQLKVSVGMTFDHIGEEPNVEIPKETIGIDQASRLLTGESESEQKFNKQSDNISDIREALRNYQSYNAAYPESLTKLLEKPINNTNTNKFLNTLGDNYFSLFAKRQTIPNDIYSGKAFVYEKTTNGYTLKYTMHLPIVNTGLSLNSLFGGSVSFTETGQYVEGINTATQDLLSVEKQAEKDKESGITAEDRTKATQFESQRDAVERLRSALSSYQVTNKAYPTNLDALMVKPTNTNISYLLGQSLPIDIFTEKPFIYNGTKDYYSLVYTMHLPNKATSSYMPGMPYISSSDLKLFVEGNNTATDHVLSVEAENLNKPKVSNTITNLNVNGYSLTYPPIVNSKNSVSKQEYIYFVTNAAKVQTNDSVGMRIEPNLDQLTPKQWYTNTFKIEAKGTEETVGGFKALRIGRSVYVSANWKNPLSANTKLEPYLFSFSYSNKYDSMTEMVFDAFLKSISFTSLPIPTTTSG